MIRRDFLRHLTATAAGLLVADDALALLAEPRRKLWPGWTAPPSGWPLPSLVYTAESGWLMDGAPLDGYQRRLLDAARILNGPLES